MVKHNIILIGMPGVGKTTLGRLVAQQTELSFVDLDEWIEQHSHHDIPSLFARGETCFRDWESKACQQVSTYEHTLVATGGGVVLRAQNMTLLQRTGHILWLYRPLYQLRRTLQGEHRPLLQGSKTRLRTLYKERYELYRQYGDVCICNTKTEQQTIDKMTCYIQHYFAANKP